MYIFHAINFMNSGRELKNFGRQKYDSDAQMPYLFSKAVKVYRPPCAGGKLRPGVLMYDINA